MAVYFLRSKHISRSNGSRVTRAAAYRAGERIRNEGTSEVFDYSSRRDVAYKEIVLPADLAGRAEMAWAQDRSTLWNAAEHAGLRSTTDPRQSPPQGEGVDSNSSRLRRREQDLER